MNEVEFIDSENLARLRGVELQNGGIEFKGWRVESSHGPMSRDADLESLKTKLDNVTRTPEIVFLENGLRLHHLRTGSTVEFNALEALKGWRLENLPPFRLKMSAEWMNGRREDIERHQAKQLQYDWTFTTPYNGTIRKPRSPLNASTSGTDAVFVECKDGLDYKLLKSRQDPILFYDAITLYESELDDMGCCQCKVWIRVMPQYWFIVLRYFLRIDDHLIRLRETRLFSKFADENEVKREVKQWEVTIDDLKRNGTLDNVAVYRSAESVAEVLRDLYPFGLVLNRTDKCLLPIENVRSH